MAKLDTPRALRTVADAAVFVGLLLVAIQIHQATRQAAAAAHQERVNEVDVSLQQYALSSDLPAIYVKLRQSGLESLDTLERERVRSWELARLIRMQGQHHQHRQGFLDEISYRDMLENARRYIDLWDALELETEDRDFLEAVRRSE